MQFTHILKKMSCSTIKRNPRPYTLAKPIVNYFTIKPSILEKVLCCIIFLCILGYCGLFLYLITNIMVGNNTKKNVTTS